MSLVCTQTPPKMGDRGQLGTRSRLKQGRSKQCRSGQAKCRSKVVRAKRAKKFLPLIELNTSVPQEGCLHHCCSLHGKPLSVSNSETS